MWYLNSPHALSLNRYLELSTDLQQQYLKQIDLQRRKVSLIAFCLMPNHFHLLIKQQEDNGISKYVSDFQNAVTKYFNIKNKLIGPLFQRQFKSVIIPSEVILLHVSRYIHLNPYTAKIVHSSQSLVDYPYSSFLMYLHRELDVHQMIDYSLLDYHFSSPEEHFEFVDNYKEHQRTLHELAKQYLDS